MRLISINTVTNKYGEYYLVLALVPYYFFGIMLTRRVRVFTREVNGNPFDWRTTIDSDNDHIVTNTRKLKTLMRWLNDHQKFIEKKS